jgi:RNA polymerase sigma-70 factor, ECF subfamily
MAAGILGSRALSKGPPERAPAAAGPDFAAVYEAHFRYVWRCLRSLGVRESALDDAMQDVFLVVQRRLVEFDGQVELRTWLYAIALRVARKHWTRAHKDQTRTESSDTLSESALPVTDGEHVAESNERLSLARRALATLDDDKRVVFVLARVEQMSAPEIAAILSVPLNTVYSRLRAAREAFEAEVRRLQLRGRSPHEE